VNVLCCADDTQRRPHTMFPGLTSHANPVASVSLMTVLLL
jgi:hypothetical protein